LTDPDSRRLEGWIIVGWAALIVVVMVAVILWVLGPTEAGVRVVLRATARTSLILFVAAFIASALRRLVRTPLTAWLLRNRRQLGVSFAISHAIHGAAIVALVRMTGRGSDATTAIAGGIGYLLLAAMAATSFDRTAAWLGPRAWSRLHRFGILYLWFIFAFTYVGSALRDPLAAASLLVLFAALGVRLVARRRRRLLGNTA
jgi:DMSO/TMAO reductase YedYZ heme-binding membrane subunit